MIPFRAIVVYELSYEVPKVPSPSGTTRSRHSVLIDRMKRSAWALQFGADAGVRTTEPPSSLNTRNILRGWTLR